MSRIMTSDLDSIVKVECMHFCSDWTEIEEIEINLDEWIFFSVEYRGKDSWHIVGYKCDSDYKWTQEELSDHQVSSIYNLAKFIAQANKYEKEKSCQPCKVSRFNNLHYNSSFYEELQRLLELVKKLESEDRQ